MLPGASLEIMRVGLVLSIAAACVGFVTCGGASCLSVLNFEPPHPHHMIPVADTAAHPERARYEVPPGGDRDLSISVYPSTGTCTLEVRDAGGKVLGRGTGGLCLVGLRGHPGETWSFAATSSAPDAEIQIADENPIFPTPLKQVAAGSALLTVVGIVGFVLALLLGRKRAPG